jgi:hypothetical protein
VYLVGSISDEHGAIGREIEVVPVEVDRDDRGSVRDLDLEQLA